MSMTVEMIDLGRINRRPGDFCFRWGGVDRHHKADLVQALGRNGGKPFDPVTLWVDPEAQANSKLTVLDGLHRIAAYHAAKWSGPIPAVILQVTRKDALAVALKENTRHVLPFSQAERMDAAWRLVREPVKPRFKVNEVARLASVSGRVVDKMRARWTLMQERGEEPTGGWSRDQHEEPYGPDEGWQPMTDKARERATKELTGMIRDLLDRRKHPEMPILRDAEAVNRAVLDALGDQRFNELCEYQHGGELNEWLEFAREGDDMDHEGLADEAQDEEEPAF
ncbi:hypothetical protein [Paracoccus sp. SCSIO 75233]|uniref:hypothetical protein n=1 Tax=Paracoccus sp. SCSIO 75233 TaxID=3017782 RepID=UPI0022EFFFF8|nr:hypothetical protein [Paracoccus sp. SCSIO 75233]WBU54632.1 hypothetical protein PAF12_07340 [Paracoccus sp. SCSIO 75233]